MAGRGLTLLKPQAFAALPSLRALDLSRNAGLPLPVVDESDPSLLALLHALPRLTSLRLDAVSPEGETRLAQAFPHLRWINGRYITRIRVGEGSPPTTVLLDEPDHMGDGKTRRRQEIVDKVLMRGWARLEPMRLAGPTAQHHAELHWCLLDLPGLALGHDEEGGNIALLHMRDRRLGVTFTAAWPRVRIRAGERVTRDYLEGFPPAARAAVAPARLLDCLYGPRLARRLLPLSSGGESGGGAAVGEVKPEEEAPELEGGEAGTEPTFPIDAPFLAPTRPLLVFTDMPVLRESLGLPALFAFTDDAAGAWRTTRAWISVCLLIRNPSTPLLTMHAYDPNTDRRRHRVDGRRVTSGSTPAAAAAAVAGYAAQAGGRGRQVRHGAAPPPRRATTAVAAPNVLPPRGAPRPAPALVWM